MAVLFLVVLEGYFCKYVTVAEVTFNSQANVKIEMWESMESLMLLKSWITLGGVVFAILAAVSGAVVYVVGNKISELNAKESERLKQEIATTAGQTQDLQRRLEPRSITTDQRAKMVELLKTVTGGRVVFWYQLGDSEAFAFAELLTSILKEASWPWEATEAALIPDKQAEGVTLFVRSTEDPPPHAAILQRALREAGIEANAGSSIKVPSDAVKVVVGCKP